MTGKITQMVPITRDSDIRIPLNPELSEEEQAELERRLAEVNKKQDFPKIVLVRIRGIVRSMRVAKFTTPGWAPTPIAKLAALEFKGVEPAVLPLVKMIHSTVQGAKLRAQPLWSCGGHRGKKPEVVIGAESWGDMITLVGAVAAAIRGPLRYFEFKPKGRVWKGLFEAYPRARFFCVLGFASRAAINHAPSKMVWRQEPGGGP